MSTYDVSDTLLSVFTYLNWEVAGGMKRKKNIKKILQRIIKTSQLILCLCMCILVHLLVLG